MQDDAFRALFPNIEGDELRLAVEIFDQYLLLAWEIMQDIEPLSDALDRPDIPGQDSSAGKVDQKL